MNNRNHSIDLLWFIASSWVVLFHLNEAVLYVDNPYGNFVGNINSGSFYSKIKELSVIHGSKTNEAVQNKLTAVGI